jgi:catechol 2,3-dioxygenase-like lactoylglutathione lyase family enzyme
MKSVLEIDRLRSVGVVVNDLDKATARYAEIFGIDHWDVREVDATRITGAWSYGRPTKPSFRTATATTTAPTGDDASPLLGLTECVPVTFELVQPLTGESPFQEFRSTRGQGISHLTLAVRSIDQFRQLRETLAEAGFQIAATIVIDDRLERHFIDTRAALGGYLVEVQVPLEPTAEDSLAVSEKWDQSDRYTRPEGVRPVALQGISHFGVVVNDVMASLAQYHKFFGIEQWGMHAWRTESGLLEDPFYREEPVNHEYFTGVAQFRDFGFEIIQPTLGPSHYKEEFRDRWGEGLHHMLLNVTADPGRWDEVRGWLASIDVPLAMGADLLGRGVAFCYYDTAKSLGGYMLEAVLFRESLDLENAGPDYVIDFATLAAKL